MLKSEGNLTNSTSKKLRFRGDPNDRIEDIFEDSLDRRKTFKSGEIPSEDEIDSKKENKEEKYEDKDNPSFLDFIKIELTRGYILEHDEERYSARRQKIYSFMKIPREVEKFMGYGVIQCADSFLYIHTFLPIRYLLALWALISRPISSCLGLRRRNRTQRLLTPAEVCDLLKGSIWIFCTLLMLSVDTNRMYHIIKTQSIIKLYIFYNMLEVGDRLLSAFGQDTIDALFWTATEPKNKRREHFGLIPHILFALIYVILHSFLIMFQATTLSVAVNANNKSFLVIMVSSNFVELKGSVFKKFDKNNLFQLSCSDVKERFHLSILLFVVVIQTMKEFSWSLDQFYEMLPHCCYVLIAEILIDWLKHAFITRFNELPVEVYREYTISLAYDMTQTRQKHAFSDHSDLVARRMGFIPFPLSVVLIKAVYAAVSFDNAGAFMLFIVAYITLVACRILNTICALGKACDLMREHQEERTQSAAATTTATLSSPTTIPVSGTNAQQNFVNTVSSGGGHVPSLITSTPKVKTHSPISEITDQNSTNYYSLQRSKTIDIVETKIKSKDKVKDKKNKLSASLVTQESHNPSSLSALGATALFSNSDVDLDDVCLNENVLNGGNGSKLDEDEEDDQVTRSVPDLQQEQQNQNDKSTQSNVDKASVHTRTHRRSESEPSIQSMIGNSEKEAPS